MKFKMSKMTSFSSYPSLSLRDDVRCYAYSPLSLRLRSVTQSPNNSACSFTIKRLYYICLG